MIKFWKKTDKKIVASYFVQGHKKSNALRTQSKYLYVEIWLKIFFAFENVFNLYELLIAKIISSNKIINSLMYYKNSKL